MLGRGAAGAEISKIILLFLAVVVAAVALRFPLATALVFLALTDFIFYPTAFAREVGPLSVRPHELALVALLALAIVRPKRRTWGGVPGTALAVFLALLALSDLVAIGNGSTSMSEALSWARPLSLLTFFYVIVRLFPSARDRKLLLMGAAVVGAATGAVALLAALGGSIGEELQRAAPQTIRLSEGEGSLERVRLPGLSAGYAMFWYAATQIAAKRGRGRVWWSVLLAGIAIDIVVSFNRNMWVGILIGLVLMAMVGGSFLRGKLIATVAAVVAGVVVIVVFGSSTTSNKVVQPVIERGATILSPGKTSQEDSVTERERETKVAWRTAKANPLLGVGAGASFGMLTRQSVGSASLITGYVEVPQLFLHNQYLYLVLISGVFGLLAFVIFLAVPAAHAFRRSPSDPAIAACGVGIAIIMISSVVAIYFTVENMTGILGLLAGVIIADREGPAESGLSSGLLE